MAGTRAQSCDRCGSGTLNPGQVFGGSLPLLSPAFRRSHFCLQVPGACTSATTRQFLAAKGGTVGEKLSGNFCLNTDFHLTLGIFTCRKSTTWDRRLYFPSEGRRAEDFFALKIRRLRPGFNPRTWVLKTGTLHLDHRILQ